MQIQNTIAGTNNKNNPNLSNRKCIKYDIINAALISDNPTKIVIIKCTSSRS